MKSLVALVLFLTAVAVSAQTPLKVSVGTFDRVAKHWSLQVTGGDAKTPVNQTVFYSLKNSTNLATEFRAFSSLIQSKTLAAQLEGTQIALGSKNGSSAFQSLVRLPLFSPPETVSVAGGTFRAFDLPRLVTLSSFVMTKTLVTQDLYQRVMGSNPSAGKGVDAPQRPVESLTWREAVDFCNRLSLLMGLEPVYTFTEKAYLDSASPGQKKQFVLQDLNKTGWRLPTSAEWEWAARGGVKSQNFHYAGGDVATLVAWTGEDSEDRTHPVGTKAPNELGLYDMSGNVSQWLWDLWDEADPGRPEGLHGGTYPVTDPVGWGVVSQDLLFRLSRGGSFRDAGWNSRLAIQSLSFASAEERRNDLGFRLVRRVSPGLPRPVLGQPAEKPRDADTVLAGVERAWASGRGLEDALNDLGAQSWWTAPQAGVVTGEAARLVVTSSDPAFPFKKTFASGVAPGSPEEAALSRALKAGTLRAQLSYLLRPLGRSTYALWIQGIVVGELSGGVWKDLGLFRSGPPAGFEQTFFLTAFRMADARRVPLRSVVDEVKVPSGAVTGFFMTKTPITVAAYQTLTGRVRTSNSGGLLAPLRPIDRVNWVEAATFANTLSQAEGLEPVYTIQGSSAQPNLEKNGWRLPTREEYAWARGATLPASEVNWSWDNWERTTHPSGLKKPNDRGLYDMWGNVRVWSAEQKIVGASLGQMWPPEQDTEDFQTADPKQAVPLVGIRLVRLDTSAARVLAAPRAEASSDLPLTRDTLLSVGKDGRLAALTGTQWRPLNATARQVAYAPDGTIWKIGTTPQDGGYDISRWTGEAWQAVDGAATRVAVDNSSQAWVVNSLGSLFYRDRKTDSWVFVPTKPEKTTLDLAMGPLGSQTLWRLGTETVPGGHGVWLFDGAGTWSRMAGAFEKLAASADGSLWALDAAGAVYRLQDPYGKGKWTLVPGRGRDFINGAGGQVYLIPDADTYGLLGWDGAAWKPVKAAP